MNCIFCKVSKTKVIDSRILKTKGTYRRRECLDCGFRFSTYEKVTPKHVKMAKNGITRCSYCGKLVTNNKKCCEKFIQ